MGFRIESGICESMKYGQPSASRAHGWRAGHAVITRYVLMTVLAASRVYREKETARRLK